MIWSLKTKCLPQPDTRFPDDQCFSICREKNTHLHNNHLVSVILNRFTAETTPLMLCIIPLLISLPCPIRSCDLEAAVELALVNGWVLIPLSHNKIKEWYSHEYFSYTAATLESACTGLQKRNWRWHPLLMLHHKIHILQQLNRDSAVKIQWAVNTISN